MKKIIFLLAILISLSATKSFAQNNDARMQKMQEAWKEYLKDSVKLSDAMTDSVLVIRMQYMPQMRDIFMDQNSTPADKETKLQNIRTQIESRYKTAGITNEQVAAIHKHEDEMRSRMMNRNGGGQ